MLTAVGAVWQYSPGDGGAGELGKIPNIAQFRGIKWQLKNVIFSKFHDVLPWRHRRPPNRQPLSNAPSSGQISRFNVGESSSLLNVAAWQLLNHLGSKILLRFRFVMVRRQAGFDYPDIWHSPIPTWQLPESLLAENLLHKRLVDTGVETLPK
jgi:hypothetical protein